MTQAAALGHLLVSFSFNKPGIQILVRALIDVGRTVPSGKEMAINQLLRAVSAVSSTIRKMKLSGRAEFKLKELPQILKRSSGIIIDGAKNNLTCTKYFDNFISWYSLYEPHRLQNIKSIFFCHALYFSTSTMGLRVQVH